MTMGLIAGFFFGTLVIDWLKTLFKKGKETKVQKRPRRAMNIRRWGRRRKRKKEERKKKKEGEKDTWYG